MDSEQPTKPRKARARSGKKIELNHDRGSQLDLSQNRVPQSQTLVYHQIPLKYKSFFESAVYTILVHDFPPKIATMSNYVFKQSQLPHVSDIFGQIQLTMVTILHPGMCAFAPTRKTDVALNTYRPPSRGCVRHGAASATARNWCCENLTPNWKAKESQTKNPCESLKINPLGKIGKQSECTLSLLFSKSPAAGRFFLPCGRRLFYAIL